MKRGLIVALLVIGCAHSKPKVVEQVIEPALNWGADEWTDRVWAWKNLHCGHVSPEIGGMSAAQCEGFWRMHLGGLEAMRVELEKMNIKNLMERQQEHSSMERQGTERQGAETP